MIALTFLATDLPIHLGRDPMNECAGVQLRCKTCNEFERERYIARSNSTFVAVIGPAANPRGYTALAGER